MLQEVGVFDDINCICVLTVGNNCSAASSIFKILTKSLLDAIDIIINIQMLPIYVGDHRNSWVIIMEVPIIIIGLQYKELTLAHAKIIAI